MHNPFTSTQKDGPLRPVPEPDSDKNKLAFGRLYDQYASLLLGVLTRMVSDKAEAVRLLEQSFVTIHQQIGKLEAGKQRSFINLLRIAHRTASDALALRKQRRISSLGLTETGKLTTPPWQVTRSTPAREVPENTADGQRGKFLNDILFHNCTLEEAAASAGIPIDQARQQLRVAVRQLRNLPLRQ